jgi:CcmD family protein
MNTAYIVAAYLLVAVVIGSYVLRLRRRLRALEDEDEERRRGSSSSEAR